MRIFETGIRRSGPAWWLAPLVLVLAAGCGGESSSGAAGGGGGGPTPGGTAAVCLRGAPESLDPFVSSDQAALQLGSLLFTPLVRYGPGTAMEPYLARSWTWGDGHRLLTFRLRTDLNWHDGHPVTARDVAFTLRRASDSAYDYPGRAALQGLDSVAVLDSATVQLRFRRPLAAGLEVFAPLPILPEHLLGTLDPQAFRNAPYHHQPVGSGPYKLVAWKSDGTIEFEHAQGFPADLGRDYLDRIVFTVVPEPTTRVAEMRTGGVDACLVGAGQTTDMGALAGVRVFPVPPVATDAIFLDMRQKVFTDVRVRRALSAALDRKEIAAVESGLAVPARGPLPPDEPYADSEALQPDADPALADSLLAAAGWREPPSGKGPRTGPDGRKLEFTLVAPPQGQNLVTAIQAELARVGFDLKPQIMEFAALVGRIQDPAQRPPAVLLGTSLRRRLRPDFYTSLVTGDGTNISSYSNPAVDSAVERLRVAIDSTAVAAQYRILQERVARDVPVVYLIRFSPGLAVGPRLHGVKVGPNGPFASAPSWWIPASQRH